MKICIALLMTAASHMTGDFENAFMLYKELKKQGHSVRLITSKLKKKISGVEFYSNNEWEDSKLIGFCRKFVRKINSFEDEFDVIHLFYPTISFCVLNKHIHKKSRIITHIANPLPDKKWYSLMLSDFSYFFRSLTYNKSMFRFSKHKSDLFVVSSNYQKKQLCRLGVDEKKILVVYNFVNFEKLNMSSKSSMSIKSSKPAYSYSSYKKPLICYIGHFTRTKGVEYLLHAFALVKKQIPNATLVLAWSGNGSKKRIARLIKELGLKDVHILGEVNVNALLKSSDVMVLPYILNFGTHIFPNALLEAMAVGTRIVVSDFGFMREIITDKKQAFLAKPKNAENLAKKILGALKINKKEFAMHQSKTIDKFRPEVLISKYNEAYKKLDVFDSDYKAEFYKRKNIVIKYGQKRFGGKSGGYINAEELNPYVDFIRDNLGDKDKILDMPVGTGRLAIKLKEINKQVSGADLSQEMINYTGDRLKIPLHLCDAKKTNFKDNTFEAVVSVRFFQHFNNILDFLREMKRITKKNGYIMFDVFGWSPQSMVSSKSLKVYPHSLREIKEIARKNNLKLVKKESKFMLPPLLLRRMPLFLVKFSRLVEKILPASFKVRHFFIFQNKK